MSDNRTRVVFILIVACSLLGVALMVYSTTWGAVITSDSVYYIGSADNLVKGVGFGLPWGSGRFLPYAGDPPFYPLLIAGLELMGLSAVSAARWVAVLSFGLTILAVGLLGWRASGSPGLALALSLLVLISAMLTDLYPRAMSEPIFFLTGLSGALWLLCYLESTRLSDLLLASVLLSAAFLTRYMGVALLLAGGICLITMTRLSWRTRLGHAALLTAVTCLPMVGWLAWTYTQTGMLGERSLRSGVNLWQATGNFRLAFADILWSWLPFSASIPVGYNAQKVLLGLLFLLLLVGGGVLAWRGSKSTANRSTSLSLLRWVLFFGLFAFFFSLVYALAYAFTLPTPDLNERLFSPLSIAISFIIFALLFLVAQSGPRWRALFALPLLALALVLADNLPTQIQSARTLHQEGSGYTSRYWRQSPVIAALMQLPPDTLVITNEADAVLFLTGLPVVWLPDVITSQPEEAFTRFGDSPENLPEEAAFRERGAALAIFPSAARQLQGLYGEKTAQRLETLTQGLAEFARFGPLEAVYFYRPEFIP